MTLSRFSSFRRKRQRAVPSPPSSAVLKLERASVSCVGSAADWTCHKRKAVHRAMKSLGKVTMHDDSRFGFLGKVAQVPGMLALLETAILTHAAPVVAIKDETGIAEQAIGQVDGPLAGRDAIIPAAHDHGIDGLPFVIAPMRVLRLLGRPIHIIGRQSLNAHQFGAQALL